MGTICVTVACDFENECGNALNLLNLSSTTCLVQDYTCSCTAVSSIEGLDCFAVSPIAIAG
jgi:hypothetical protein